MGQDIDAMSNRETPYTDAAERNGCHLIDEQVVPVEFARVLEIELQVLKEHHHTCITRLEMELVHLRGRSSGAGY